ncbi:MAG: LLM class flavin-dependent oxidoreductase [Proteobacteria bacterium]|nr:LLM class flavin-dependent oxidoreductase [Pseudomonadota bacterium]
MVLVGFLQAQNCSNFSASWRHPESRTDFMTKDFYQHIGKVLEAGKFQLAFFDDRLSMPEFQSGNYQDAVENGVRCVKMDAFTCMTAIGMATERLGLGVTYSTTYYEPFHVARMFATLDQLTDGRAAWNIVTSLNDAEARNMGRDAMLGHDERYDRADEFIEVVLGHWDTWADDAIAINKATGHFADPKKVRRLDHKGKYFTSKGPFTVPRSAQGHPVLIQAGQSGRGKRFATEWGEVIFSYQLGIEAAKKSYADMKASCAATGRDPDSMKIATLVYPVVAETRAEAEDKRALLESLPKEIDSLLLLTEAMNFDFGSKPLDEPFTDEELKKFSLQTIRDRVLGQTGGRNPTVREFIQISGRGKLQNPWVGSPKDVADKFEEYFTAPASDGFVIGATSVPGTYEDFVRLVVPELQRRGLFHKEYKGRTLRENLGLERPGVGAWHGVKRGA